jgi:hypothetical protein
MATAAAPLKCLRTQHNLRRGIKLQVIEQNSVFHFCTIKCIETISIGIRLNLFPRISKLRLQLLNERVKAIEICTFLARFAAAIDQDPSC